MAIYLNSNLNDSELDLGNRPPDLISSDIMGGYSHFIGRLTFIVNGIDFSEGELPILFFARNLRKARCWMLVDIKKAIFVMSNYVESPTHI